MRRICLSILGILILATTGIVLAGDSGGDAILGLWKTEPDAHGYSYVEVVKTGDRYDGRIVYLSKPRYGPDEERPGEIKVDLNNPDPSVREHRVLGLEILKGFVYKGKGKWKNGTIYDPTNGKTYKCKMWLEGQDTLKVRGFIGFSLLGRNTTWTKTPANAREQIAAQQLELNPKAVEPQKTEPVEPAPTG